MPRPSIELPKPRDIGVRQWGREILLVETEHYIGKKLLMTAGKAGGLQYHREKVESFLLHSGNAYVDWDDGSGELRRLELFLGQLVHVPAGAPHRVTAITDCVFFEWSTPVFNDRVRCEAEYGEPETGEGLPTTSVDAVKDHYP